MRVYHNDIYFVKTFCNASKINGIEEAFSRRFRREE